MITNQDLTEMLYKTYKEKIPEIDSILEEYINELKSEVLNGDINYKVCIDDLRYHELFEYIKKRAKQLGYDITSTSKRHGDAWGYINSFYLGLNKEKLNPLLKD